MSLEEIVETKEVIVNKMKRRLITPNEIKARYPLDNGSEETVLNSRRDIAKILEGKDNRLLIITGPCSIDNTDAALEYARKLRELQSEVKEKVYLVMRTYFEKPRTTIGWTGFIPDPNQDNSHHFEEGLNKARKLLKEITKREIPCATEFLNPLVALYIEDLISYGSIGARTTESQTSRELASSLLMSIGFKNSTGGDIEPAINGIISAQGSHSYLGIDNNGQISVINSNGNIYAHPILRGGTNGPNYDETSIRNAIELLEKKGLNKGIVVDCSHANSQKDYNRQTRIAEEVIRQRGQNPKIRGLMIESYLLEGQGNQYGQSKTDGCINWETTYKLIKDINQKLG